jgi:DNA-directed RNA polymerase specialized sigma24 family protein
LDTGHRRAGQGALGDPAGERENILMFRRPPEERDQMDRLFDQGLSYREIGEKFGMSGQAVRLTLGRRPRYKRRARWRLLTVTNQR